LTKLVEIGKIFTMENKINFNQKDFEKSLKKVGVSNDVISEIINVVYERSDNEKQDNVNYCSAVIKKCKKC